MVSKLDGASGPGLAGGKGVGDAPRPFDPTAATSKKSATKRPPDGVGGRKQQPVAAGLGAQALGLAATLRANAQGIYPPSLEIGDHHVNNAVLGTGNFGHPVFETNGVYLIGSQEQGPEEVRSAALRVLIGRDGQLQLVRTPSVLDPTTWQSFPNFAAAPADLQAQAIQMMRTVLEGIQNQALNLASQHIWPGMGRRGGIVPP